MSDNGNSLIGFLKKKSLFSNSPIKQNKLKNRSRSKSRDSKDFAQRSENKNAHEQESYLPESNSQKLLHKTSEKNLRQFNENFEDRYSPKNNIRYTQKASENEPRFNRFTESEAKRNSKNPEDPFVSFAKNQQEEQGKNNFWTGLVSSSTSFESARIESAQCLETLSVKIHSEISNINYKLDMFNGKMSKVLNTEFKNLKEKIHILVEQIFKEAEKHIIEYMKSQEQALALEVLKVKDHLEKQYIKIETMKEEISKPQWRKVAGELLSSELEQKIEQTIRQSSTLEIGHWSIGEIGGGGKIQNLQHHIRQIVKLAR